MKGRVLVGLALLALSAGASAQVFKCVDGQGRVTFSQTPCVGQKSDAVDVKIDKSRPASSQPSLRGTGEFDRINKSIRSGGAVSKRPQARERRTNCKEFNSTALRTMIVKRQVVVGMTRKNALDAWGKPTRVNGDQYVYHWPEASAYFYVADDGCVDGVQGSFRGK